MGGPEQKTLLVKWPFATAKMRATICSSIFATLFSNSRRKLLQIRLAGFSGWLLTLFGWLVRESWLVWLVDSTGWLANKLVDSTGWLANKLLADCCRLFALPCCMDGRNGYCSALSHLGCPSLARLVESCFPAATSIKLLLAKQWRT